MDTYLINYDLRGSRDYDSLYKAIKAYKVWAHILESTWAIQPSPATNTKDIRENLLKYMDTDDGLFITKSSGIASWSNIIAKNDWLKNNL